MIADSNGPLALACRFQQFSGRSSEAERHRGIAGNEASQFLDSRRMLQFLDCLRFNLTDPFPSHLEDSADFFQRVIVAVDQPIPQTDDLPFPEGQRFEQVFNPLPLDAVIGEAGGAFISR